MTLFTMMIIRTPVPGTVIPAKLVLRESGGAGIHRRILSNNSVFSTLPFNANLQKLLG
jgi:hypothetical protein